MRQAGRGQFRGERRRGYSLIEVLITVMIIQMISGMGGGECQFGAEVREIEPGGATGGGGATICANAGDEQRPAGGGWNSIQARTM